MTAEASYRLPPLRSSFDTAIDSMLTEQNDNDTSEDSLGEGFRWSHAAVLLLLEEYRLCEKNMSSGKITQKRAWDQISKEMIGKGYFVTGKKCSTRINTMKRTYKVVEDHNGKSGNNKRTWPYYDIMESLLGKKPYMAPLSTLSSSGAETCNSSCSSPIPCTVAADDNNHILRKSLSYLLKMKNQLHYFSFKRDF
ncbi:uncharacterized protein LOC116849238 [Odontomachus brunneus]|uniref:uncharacterized protein LOC116849238 n=1 Tax=Odontomachus brunneus TaxID=486640 RepID=UPI0013F295F8|nr:uncharacterized protein LOC116849238 [Odontomachus brunneus]